MQTLDESLDELRRQSEEFYNELRDQGIGHAQAATLVISIIFNQGHDLGFSLDECILLTGEVLKTLNDKEDAT